MPERQKTVLLEVLGESPELEVIDALVDNPVFDLTADGISGISGLGSAEVQKILDEMGSWGIVEEKGVEGEKCYSLNTSNDAVRHLVRFELELFGRGAERGSAL